MQNEGYKKQSSRYIIGIDFDGTIVTHEYPRVGKPVKLAKEVIEMLVSNGHRCFLFSMRDGKELADAKNYCEFNGIELCGYNESPEQFSDSPKQYGTFYIDDAAIGCPLEFDPKFSHRPYVNWFEIAKYLASYGLLSQDQLDILRKL